MSECRYSNDESGCLILIVMVFCLWLQCDKIDRVERKVDDVIRTIDRAERETGTP